MAGLAPSGEASAGIASPRGSSPEVRPLCPQPRRACPLLPATPSQARSGSKGSLASSPDQAAGELQGLLGSENRWQLEGSSPLPAHRSISAASTSAGPTPCPDEARGELQGILGSESRWQLESGSLGPAPCPDEAPGGRWMSPQATRSPGASSMEGYSSPSRSFHAPGAGSAGSRRQSGDISQKTRPQPESGTLVDRRSSGASSSSGQEQKIFVGGVPQDFGQEDLHAVFSEFAEVKKAWLQKFRQLNNSHANSWQNHRGFGFVIFRHPDAVDRLLGNNFSQFITLANGKRLEVKRAISSSKMHGPGSEVAQGEHSSVGSMSPQWPRPPTSGRGSPVLQTPPPMATTPPPMGTWPVHAQVPAHCPAPMAAVPIAPRPSGNCTGGMGSPMMQPPQGYGAMPQAMASEAGMMLVGYVAPPTVAGNASPMRYTGRMEPGGMVHPSSPVPPMPHVGAACGMMTLGRPLQEPYSPVGVAGMPGAVMGLQPQAKYPGVPLPPPLPLVGGRDRGVPTPSAPWPGTLEELSVPVVGPIARPLMATAPQGSGAHIATQPTAAAAARIAPGMMLQGGAWAAPDANRAQPSPKELESMLLQAMPETYDD